MASSIRARAREDELGDEEGGGSGPNVRGGEDSGEDVGVLWSGELGEFRKRTVFRSKKSG